MADDVDETVDEEISDRNATQDELDNDEFDKARAIATIRKQRESEFAAIKRAKELEAKVQEFEQRDLTEQQKLEKRAAEAESKLAPATLENLRLRVAIDKKLPVELVDRLQGSTKEEIEADADNLLKLVKSSGGNGGGSGFDGGARGDAPTTDMDTLIRQRAGVA